MNEYTFELIAEQVDGAWAAEKVRQGCADHAWAAMSDKPDQCAGRPHFEPPCDMPKHRHHDDMLPYADLAEHIKDYDRVTVRAVLAGIEAAGLQVVPTAPPPPAAQLTANPGHNRERI